MQYDTKYTKALFLGKREARLDRSGAYRLINKACSIVCPNVNVGTHTMRKTFGYHHYQKFHDVVLLQQIFNHSAPHITLRYIGITQDQINDSYKALNLFDDPPAKIEPRTEVLRAERKSIKPVIKKEKQREKRDDTEIIAAIKDYLENNGVRHRDFLQIPAIARIVKKGENMKISKREREVLRLIAFSNPQIARRLGISIRTVKTYIRHLFEKLGCESRTGAAIKAIKEGIIQVNEVYTDE